VIFERDSIVERMGPQFVTIRTTVQSREEARFKRSNGAPDISGVVIQPDASCSPVRKAYGATPQSCAELEQVHLHWTLLPIGGHQVNVHTDYT